MRVTWRKQQPWKRSRIQCKMHEASLQQLWKHKPKHSKCNASPEQTWKRDGKHRSNAKLRQDHRITSAEHNPKKQTPAWTAASKCQHGSAAAS
jgi:hypothetical protein